MVDKAWLFGMAKGVRSRVEKTWNEVNSLAKIERKWNVWKDLTLPARVNKFHHYATMPVSIFFLTYSAHVHPAYQLTRWKRARLALRFFVNNARMESLSSSRAHVVMAMKLLEIPPEVEGDVVECGCFKGAMTVNLSLACQIAGRKLKVYDSFEGLPPPDKPDVVWPKGVPYIPGVFKGALEEVQGNVRRLGAFDVCEFHKGWFKDTLPHHEGKIALAVVDVDYHSSLYDCVTNLWPALVDNGYFFIDEYVYPDYCAIFYSEKFWRTHFNTVPPGLIGAGSGVQVGEYYIGPWHELQMNHNPGSIGYAQKGQKAIWDFYPKEANGAGTDAEAARPKSSPSE
jgi:O-methyltransferase